MNTFEAIAARVSVRDDYTVEVFLPQMMENEYYAVSRFAFTGELSLRYGTSEDTATDALKIKVGETVADYVSGVSAGASGGTHYVVLNFTDAGAEAIAKATASAGSSSDSSDSSSSSTTNYLYTYGRETAIISLTGSEPIPNDAL